MVSSEYPLLTFTCEFDDRTAFEVEEKGYFDHAVVTLEDGTRYALHFYDPARLAYELKAEQQDSFWRWHQLLNLPRELPALELKFQ